MGTMPRLKLRMTVRQQMRRVMSATVVLWPLVGIAAAFAGNQQPSDTRTTTSTPTSQPATTQPSEDEPADVQKSACTALEAEIEKSYTPAQRATACLAAARCVLTKECAAPLSFLLNGGKTGQEFVNTVGRGLDHLQCAGSALDKVPADAMSEADRKRMHRRIDLLGAFGRMFAVLAADDDSEAAHGKLNAACLDLSIYMDVANTDIVESAKLYVAAAYRRADRSDRAMTILWPAATPYSSTRVEYLARLERCRALVDNEHFVAALALNNRLSGKSEAWFRSQGEEVQKEAADSARWLRIEILHEWAASLRKSGEGAQAKAIDKQAKELLGDDAEPKPTSKWLQLNVTVEGLLDWSASGDSNEETTSAPTTSQDSDEP